MGEKQEEVTQEKLGRKVMGREKGVRGSDWGREVTGERQAGVMTGHWAKEDVKRYRSLPSVACCLLLLRWVPLGGVPRPEEG